MKIIYIYYSYEGTTKKLVEEMLEEVKGETFRLVIKDEKIYKNTAVKYIWGATKILMKSKPVVENLNLNLKDYDLIIIGTPVWGGTYAPAIRTLFDKLEFKDLKVAYFYSDLGEKGKIENAFRKALENCEIKGSLHLERASKNMEESKREVKKWIKNITNTKK